MKIGVPELVVVFIVALLVIGPDKLPQYARRFGAAMREFRRASADVTQDIRESVIDPLEEAQKPLRDAMEPIEELERDLKADLRGVEADMKNIGRSGRKNAAAESPAAPEEAEDSAVPADCGAQERSSDENNGGAST